MLTWRANRNAAARRTLEAALPPVFPAVVLGHALGQSWVPHLPRLAVESYWRAHPVRADRLARALARRSGTPEGWHWHVSTARSPGVAASFRVPPAPYREAAFDRGPGHCCLCGQPVFRFGWHRDLWASGKVNTRARWHAACVAAWKLWLAPNTHLKMLGRIQGRRCAVTGGRLLRDAEADHRVPLFRVWRDARHMPWPDLLGYWGFPNLQAVNRPAHRAKSISEAAARTSDRRGKTGAPQSAAS